MSVLGLAFLYGNYVEDLSRDHPLGWVYIFTPVSSSPFYSFV